MTAHHELLQVTVAQDRSVMGVIGARIDSISRVKRFSEIQETAAAQGHHTRKTVELGNLAKVDLLRCSHALGKCGLFDNVETTMKHLHKKGDVVNVFQMDVRRGLMFEGRATVLKPTDSPGEERYLVRFHGPDGKPSLGEEYERWIDRDGQSDPEAYVKATNKRLNIAA